MQPPPQTVSVLSFIGVVVQLGGALMLIALFMLLRRFVLRRGYFSAWVAGWAAFAVAITALVVRYVLLPGLFGTPINEGDPMARAFYLVYQISKGLGFVFFLRGTLMYVSGATSGYRATRYAWMVVTGLAIVSTLVSRRGLNELVIWQCAIALPVLGYCAVALLRLPRPRRTAGTLSAGICFGLLGALWMSYAVLFAATLRGQTSLLEFASGFVAMNPYFDLTLNVLLGYAMVLLLMEDSRREIDAAQAELRVTHDQLRRAALYDSLTDSLNRRAFAEGVGLDMVRAGFGTVVLADLDNLKVVNDTYGHAYGDVLLRQCADVIRATLRSYDKLYRWGGDEFLLIVPSAHADAVLRRLQLALESAGPTDTGVPGQRVQLAVSLGAADYASFEDLALSMEHADRAMYAEKNRRKRDARADRLDAAMSPTSVAAVR
jgi:diguanylate cyclase (GGDEF)-like protein